MIHAKANAAMSHKYITSKNTTNSKKHPRFVPRGSVYAVSIKRSAHVKTDGSTKCKRFHYNLGNSQLKEIFKRKT